LIFQILKGCIPQKLSGKVYTFVTTTVNFVTNVTIER
jgi:hypothetical protein